MAWRWRGFPSFTDKSPEFARDMQGRLSAVRRALQIPSQHPDRIGPFEAVRPAAVDFALLGLFSSAFISSTLFPGGSEAILAYLSTQEYSALTLLLVATAGNTLGGMSSWLIGRWLVNRRPLAGLKERHQTALERMRRWGSPALLLSWLPIIGDPLCLAAGVLRIPWLPALLYIAAGKAVRYAAVLWLMTG